MRKCRIIQRIMTGAYYLLLLLPVLGFLDTGAAWGEPVWNGRRLELIWNSCLLAFLSACGCTVLGVWAAAGIHNGRLRNSGRRWFFLLLAPVPYYIYALTWMYLVRLAGSGNQRQLSVSMTGLLPCIFVNILTFLPMTAGLILTAMEHCDRQSEEQARVYAPDHEVLFRIVLPAIWPSVCAAGILVFVLSVTDFSVPSLFQYQTYTLELFSEYSRGCSLGQIGRLSLPLILPVLGLTLLAFWGLRTVPAGSLPMGREGLRLKGIWSLPGRLGVWMCVLQLTVPAAVFLLEIQDWNNVWNSVLLCKGELAASAVIAALAALTALAAAGPAGVWITRRGPGVKALAFLPIAVPSSLVGMGLLHAVNGSPVHWISRTVYFPALGCAVKYMPFAALLFMARTRRIPAEELELARVYARSEGEYVRRVLLPAYRPALLGAGALVFLLTLGEEGITLVLMPPGYETLAVKVYNYLHYGASELVSGFCLLTVLATAGMMLGTGMLIRGQRRRKRLEGDL